MQTIFAAVLFFVFLACAAGVVFPYAKALKRWQFALLASGALVLLMAVAPNTGSDGGKLPLAPLPFLFLLLACFVGLAHPYIRGSRRWHFGLGAIAAFTGIGASLPPPTPEELAARKAEEQREAAEEARLAAQEGKETARLEHEKVVEKASPAVATATNYTRTEYGDTFNRVGASTFGRLGELEPGAVYAAAESKSCDRVSLAMVSDVSKRNAAVWFVDCENQRRFMISQQQAEDALKRFTSGSLALSDLEPGCILPAAMECKRNNPNQSPAAKIAVAKEIEFVSACDGILEMALVSPSSLDTHRWRYQVTDTGKVIIERPFDSQNSFGATIRSSYRCEIDAMTTNIEGFSVSGPGGTQKII